MRECLDDAHRWNGCKCVACGTTRDQGHKWKSRRCSICKKVSEAAGLSEAVESGDVQRVIALIAAGDDVNGAHGTTPVGIAVHVMSPLGIAAQHGHLECVNALIAAKANLKAKNLPHLSGMSALALAAQGRHLDCVKALIEAKADVNATDKNGSTPLMAAALTGSVDCVNALIEAGADVNAIAKVSHRDAMGGFPCNGTAVMSAVVNSHPDCLKALIAAGADVNPRADFWGFTALIRAAQKGDLACLMTLIEAGADVDATEGLGETALSEAVSWRHVRCVEALVGANANVDARDRFGHTALYHAVIKDLDCVRLLIAAGADINAKDSTGETALIRAAYMSDPSAVQALVAAHADVDAQDNTGFTALMAAAKNGRAGGIKELIAAGANVNAADNKGRTALMLAVLDGDRECVNALAKAGADVNAQAIDGKTALSMAARKPAIVAALKRAGVKEPAVSPASSAMAEMDSCPYFVEVWERTRSIKYLTGRLGRRGWTEADADTVANDLADFGPALRIVATVALKSRWAAAQVHERIGPPDRVSCPDRIAAAAMAAIGLLPERLGESFPDNAFSLVINTRLSSLVCLGYLSPVIPSEMALKVFEAEDLIPLFHLGVLGSAKPDTTRKGSDDPIDATLFDPILQHAVRTRGRTTPVPHGLVFAVNAVEQAILDGDSLKDTAKGVALRTAACGVLGHVAAELGDVPMDVLSDAAKIASRLLRYYEPRKCFALSRHLYELAVAFQERRYGSENDQVAVTYFNFADLLRRTGDFSAARDAYRRSLEIGGACLGPDHAKNGPRYWGLAITLIELKDLSGARDLLTRSVDVGERTLEQPGVTASPRASEWTKPDTLAVRYETLGGVLRDLGDLDAACVALARSIALSGLAEEPSKRFPDRLDTHAAILLRLGRTADAVHSLQHSVEIADRLAMADAKQSLRLDTLGTLRRKQGDHSTACAPHERAVAIDAATGQTETKVGAGRLNNLAFALAAAGRYDEAEVAFESALAAAQAGCAPADSHLAILAINFAAQLRSRGKHDRAAELARRALALDTGNERKADSSLALRFKNAGVMLAEVNDWPSAVTAFEHAHRISVTLEGAGDTLDISDRLSKARAMAAEAPPSGQT
ncbi:MAG: ankyrin repeat domain-containing protein [Capsulimonadaceae bacterium]